MKCNQCDGAGVLMVARPAPRTPFYKGVTHLPPRAELCSCVVGELATLRNALVGAGLLPAEHWKREMPERGLHGSVPPELSFVVLSSRRDGYRVVSRAAGPGVAARAPDGRAMLDGNGDPLLWGRLEDAERSIDRNHPIEDEEHVTET